MGRQALRPLRMENILTYLRWMVYKKLSLPVLSEYRETNKRKNIINWIACLILMVFYAGTWLSPYFYHITEIYNSLIVFAALVILFFNNIDVTGQLKSRDYCLYALILAGLVGAANLFIIASNKGCILILADFLLIWYLSSHLRLDGRILEFMNLVFLLVFIVWFAIDLAFSYNSNTGASVTVFTFMCAMLFISRLSAKREIYGLITVLCVVRLVNLVLWHLARGAFIALALFLVFYYLVPESFYKNKRIWTALAFFSTLGSLAFVIFYVALAATGVNFQMPFFYKSLFSGREQIWLEIWKLLRDKLLTGIGSGYVLDSFFEYNIHNVMYDILAVHGCIVFVLALFLIISRMLKMRECFEASGGRALRLKLLAAAGLFAIAIESFIDMDLMWPDYSPVLLFLLLNIFSDCNLEKNKEDGNV